MNIDLQLNGKPAEVRSQLATAAKNARRDNPRAGVLVSALQDVIGAELAGVGPDETFVANISIDIPTRVLAENQSPPTTNEVRRSQAIAIEGERPAPEGSRPVLVAESSTVAVPAITNVGAGVTSKIPSDSITTK